MRRLAYKAFGEEVVNAGTGEQPTYTYTGKERDASGLMYYGARYYDPALARFITPDTVEDRGTQGLNRYSYALNNPIRYNDPTGHWSMLPPGFWNSLPGQRMAGDVQQIEQAANATVNTSGAIMEGVAQSCASNRLDCLQSSLDVAGMHPAYGELFDGTNAVISIFRWRWKDAGGRFASMIPGLGIGVTARRLAKHTKLAGEVIEHVDDAIRLAKASEEGGDILRTAYGLSRHPNHARGGLVTRFAEHLHAKTYWDLYENTTDMRLLGERGLEMMKNSTSLHFNLDGLIPSGSSLQDVMRWGSEGIGQANVTNWEFYQIVHNESFFNKTTFYLDGKVFHGVLREELLKGL